MRGQRGTIAVVALGILLVVAVLGLTLLTASQSERFQSTRTRRRTEAFYVADAGVQNVVSVLKSNANGVIGNRFPVTQSLLTTPADWGLTAANFPGGFQTNNLNGGQFIPNDATSYVQVTLPGIGRGTATVKICLKSITLGLGAHPVVFGVDSSGGVPGGVSRRILADVTLTPVGGRPPNPIQAGGLYSPILGALTAGATSIPGTVLDPGITVTIVKRVGNNWQAVGTAAAASTPAAGPYSFSLTTTPLIRGDVYSAQYTLPSGGTSPYGFPTAVR